VNVSPDLIQRTRAPADDTEDLALTFMETEVGRHDWLNNWATVKASGDIRQKVGDWLKVMEIDHDPDALVDYLDHLAATRTGKWQ